MLKNKKLLAWCLIVLLCVNLIPQSFNVVYASELDSTYVTEEFNEKVENNEKIESSPILEEPVYEQQFLDNLSVQSMTESEYQTEENKTPPVPEDANASADDVDGIEGKLSVSYGESVELLSSAGLSLAELRQKFPAGKYWNHAGNPGSSNSKNNQNGYTSTPCPKHKTVGTSAQTCNGFQPGSSQLSWQCMGYAEKLGYDATGYNPRKNANGWNTYTSSSALNNLKAGDIVRYKNDGHSIYVTDVNGDTVTYTDCNSDGHCIIRWGVTISKATLRSSFTYVRSAPSAQSPEVVSCSCSTSYAGNYVCTTSSANLNMRSGHGTSYGIVTPIPSGAVVYVSKSDGTWAHVSYNGYTGYASMQYLTKQGATQTRKSGVRTWISNSEMGDSVDSVRTGEWVYLCYKMYDGNTGDMFDSYNTIGYKVKMEIFGPSGNLEHSGEYSQDNSWISIKRTTPGTYTGKLTITFDSQYSTKVVEKTFEIVYEPRIETTVSSVDLNVLSISSQVVSIGYSGATASESIYVNTSKIGDCFTTSWGSWSNHVIPLTITGIKAGTGSVTIYLRDSDTDEILATKVITVSVEAPSYTITYSANGGSGAPSSQEKDYGVSLTLSSAVPERFGYNFVGWSRSSSASAAEYQPDSPYLANESMVLYAVWQQTEIGMRAAANVTTNITFPGKGLYYKFIPTTTTFYCIRSTGSLDTRVYIYDAQGTQLAVNDDGGENQNFQLTYQLTAGTTYYIYATLYSSSSTGSFTTELYKGCIINYDTNGGNERFDSEYYYLYYYNTNIDWSNIPTPTRSGYRFVEWNTAKDGSGKSYDLENVDISFVNTLNKAGTITLYAIWEPVTSIYTISYNANGGSGAPVSQTKAHGVTLILSATKPTRSGYTFLGWSTSSTATSASYQPGGSYTGNGNATLYAVWARDFSESENQCKVVRIYGKTRYETSYAIANVLKEQLNVNMYDTVILANGDNFPDALSGSYLANIKNAPILMAREKNKDSLQTYIRDNLKRGGDIYVLGGTNAIPESVLNGLSGYNIRRISGATRYETNLLILEEAQVTNEDILVCTGEEFADSLSASATGKPILLLNNKTITKEQIKFLEEHVGNKYYIIGGEGAISEGFEVLIGKYGIVERISGATRYETSVKVAQKFFTNPEKAVLAYAWNFPDGLCGGPLAMKMNAPLILTATKKTSAAISYVSGGAITEGKVLGGESLISDTAVKMIFNLPASAEIKGM